MTTAEIPQTAIFTIVSNNYLHFARTMLQSAKLHHPEYALYCVIVDRELKHATSYVAEFEAISIYDLALPLSDEFMFQYNILELNTAVKPWAIEYLFKRGHQNVIYVDPDIFFYQRMVEVERLLATGSDIVLTPHLLSPVTDDKQPRELDIRRAGTYNFGFCAMRSSANTNAFLHWLQSKLLRECVSDTDRGLFVDQSWIDLVPGLFENVSVLRHPGYNVAYWNIAQRPLSKGDAGSYLVASVPLVFFHFSGLNPANTEAFSKYQNRFTLSTVGRAKELVAPYVDAVKVNGYHQFQSLEYAFERFSDGEPIPDIFRNLYRLSPALRERMGAKPFACQSAMCDRWPEISIEGVSPTNAMMALWHIRRDAQFEFPLNSADSIKAYYKWFVDFPPGAQHFSASVISKHAAMLKQLDERVLKPQDSEANASQVSAGIERRVHCLYQHILNRSPDESGLLAYLEMCKTEAGFIRAWGEIGLSEESKARRFLWLRMLKALLLSSYTNKKNMTHPPSIDSSARTDQTLPTITGIFPAEADASKNGVWVTDCVIVPVSVKSSGQLRLKGFYFPDSVERQTGNSETKIRFLLGDVEIYQTQLVAHGEFIIEHKFKRVGHREAPSLLTIESSGVFVPKEIGSGNDERRLAWRMFSLSIDGNVIFHC